VRALRRIKDEGLVERIGLCNVKVGQIEEARAIAEIAAVQVELSVWHDESLCTAWSSTASPTASR
jgi:diketogulonate reductase-like aldo/keto reductase